MLPALMIRHQLQPRASARFEQARILPAPINGAGRIARFLVRTRNEGATSEWFGAVAHSCQLFGHVNPLVAFLGDPTCLAEAEPPVGREIFRHQHVRVESQL